MVNETIEVSADFYADLYTHQTVSIDDFEDWVANGTLEQLSLAYFIYSGINSQKANILYYLFFKKKKELEEKPHQVSDND